jgi:hypothetical protein
MCTPADGNYTVTFMADAANSPFCPAAPATEMTSWPEEAGTNPGACTCSGDTLTCTSMSTTDAGATLTETITYTFTPTNFTGTVTGTESGVTCKYTFTGTKM